MGRFTALKEEVYPRKPFTAFPATTAFEMTSATALAWAAQLAYETANKEKLNRILTGWGWQLDAIVDGVFSSALPITTTSGFVAHTGATTIVAFAGTEPDNLLQWIRNFSAHPVSGVHEGFQAGVQAVWRRQLAGLIDGAGEIYFTGHSLGGALGVAAAHEAGKAAVKIRGVYTMGMPRVGTVEFAQAYNNASVGPESSLGQRTFRLVHGDDVVPHVPPALAPSGYRHVGRLLSCPPGGSFAPGNLGPATIEEVDIRVALDLLSAPFRASPGRPPQPYPAENPRGGRTRGRAPLDHSRSPDGSILAGAGRDVRRERAARCIPPRVYSSGNPT